MLKPFTGDFPLLGHLLGVWTATDMAGKEQENTSSLILFCLFCLLLYFSPYYLDIQSLCPQLNHVRKT